MKIQNLYRKETEYSSNVYLVTGTWNTISDTNTLVDVGRTKAIITELLAASTGVGKKRVEQVILTHSHYDHVSLLPVIREMFNPRIYAASTSFQGVDVILHGGERIRMGDRECEVIATPGHSNDSICLYCEEDGVLFAGDTPLIIRTTDGTYGPEYVAALETICEKNVHTIYFGQGPPLQEKCNEILKESLENVRKRSRHEG
jgi:glyoxylase-like metal-dependent hydrolase (beta-lactamase superfamily II)